MPTRLQHQAQHLAALFPPLLIEAERVAQVVLQGLHGRRRAGTGETFWQFRRYEQGDPAERIDWRQSARTDKIFIKEREWEAAQSVCLWADTSGSMHYTSDKKHPTKVERARLLMLALASVLLNGSEKVIWLDRRNIAVHGKTGLQSIAARMGQGASESLPPDIPVPRHAHVVLCSDFLMPPTDLQKRMQHYAALNLRGVLLHILDPMEENYGFEGRLEMQGLEGEVPLLLPNAAALKDSYRQKMEEHKAQLQHTAQSAGWFYTKHITNELPHLILMQLYQVLAAQERGL